MEKREGIEAGDNVSQPNSNINSDIDWDCKFCHDTRIIEIPIVILNEPNPVEEYEEKKCPHCDQIDEYDQLQD